MSYYHTHKNKRYSDSSWYDEVCEDCGLTDSIYTDSNLDNTPCGKNQLEDAVREFLDAEDAVEKEAARAEEHGGWSSAPVIRRHHAIERLRELV